MNKKLHRWIIVVVCALCVSILAILLWSKTQKHIERYDEISGILKHSSFAMGGDKLFVYIKTDSGELYRLRSAPEQVLYQIQSFEPGDYVRAKGIIRPAKKSKSRIGAGNLTYEGPELYEDGDLHGATYVIDVDSIQIIRKAGAEENKESPVLQYQFKEIGK